MEHFSDNNFCVFCLFKRWTFDGTKVKCFLIHQFSEKLLLSVEKYLPTKIEKSSCHKNSSSPLPEMLQLLKVTCEDAKSSTRSRRKQTIWGMDFSPLPFPKQYFKVYLGRHFTSFFPPVWEYSFLALFPLPAFYKKLKLPSSSQGRQIDYLRYLVRQDCRSWVCLFYPSNHPWLLLPVPLEQTLGMICQQAIKKHENSVRWT